MRLQLRARGRTSRSVAAASAGTSAAFVLEKILAIATARRSEATSTWLLLRFFLRARSRTYSADASGLDRLVRPRALTRVAIVAGICVALAAPGRADIGADVTTTLFRESGGPLNMTVLTPSVNAHADIVEALGVHLDWEADIVTGASVAVVDDPGSIDAITSATKLNDVRQTVGGGIDVRGDTATLGATYTYGFESDYRSHAFSVTGRAELFERTTTLEIGYGRGFDRVCNVAEPRTEEAVDRQPLPSSSGCFKADDRTSEHLSLHTLQAGWTQAWTSIFTTQLVTTAQLLHGFQGNPYRAVWLGRAAAQEHHPENRARYGVGIGTRLWLKPLRGAVQTFARLYRDTWNVQSVTVELGYEQSVVQGLRLRARARYYRQTRAAFFSDDYVRHPRGQYFSGDRELSKMSNLTFGGQVGWTVPSNEEGEVLGFMTSLELVGKVDWINHKFEEFHYGQISVPNDSALIATFGVNAIF